MDASAPATVPTELQSWSAWAPLYEARHWAPKAPGLYRIRRVRFNGVDYIGQTGGTLPGRLGMLAGTYSNVMPYTDPHFAGPGLWAFRHSGGCDFEAAVTVGRVRYSGARGSKRWPSRCTASSAECHQR